jgi:4-amino-4-deoxy-L-arabinose transferase-like glycosyltransferase
MEMDGARLETMHPPGTPLLIAGIHHVFGIPADFPLQLLSLVIDAIAAVLVYWMGCVVLGARVGLAAGLAYAFFPPAAYMAISKAPTGILSFFVAGSLACTLQALRQTGREKWIWYAAVGLMLGVGGYFRADYILMPAFLGIGLWLFTRRFWNSVQAMVLAQIVVFVVLLPWAARNHAIYGRWIFSSTSAGGTMINGLGTFRNPWGFGPLDENRGEQAAAVGLSSAWSPEADEYFRSLFLRSIREHPVGWVTSMLYRLPVAVATPYDIGVRNTAKTQTYSGARKPGEDRIDFIKRDPGYFLRAYWDRWVPAGVTLLSLACVVIMAFVERRAGLVVLILSPHIYSIVTHLMLSHMQPYFLLPSMFCWLFGVGYVLARGWRESGGIGPFVRAYGTTTS